MSYDDTNDTSRTLYITWCQYGLVVYWVEPDVGTQHSVYQFLSDNQEVIIQSGALSLVRIVQAWLSLVESFKVFKYFHDVATPTLLCHKEPAGVATS